MRANAYLFNSQENKFESEIGKLIANEDEYRELQGINTVIDKSDLAFSSRDFKNDIQENLECVNNLNLNEFSKDDPSLQTKSNIEIPINRDEGVTKINSILLSISNSDLYEEFEFNTISSVYLQELKNSLLEASIEEGDDLKIKKIINIFSQILRFDINNNYFKFDDWETFTKLIQREIERQGSFISISELFQKISM